MRLIAPVVLLALPLAGHLFLPLAVVVRAPYTYLGILPMIAGIFLATSAANTFRAAGARFRLHGGASHLVTDGPFRITRNPMYLGMLMCFVGLSILLGSLAPFLFTVVFFLFLNYVVVPMEERSLRQMHGKEYAEYKRRVRRWV